MTETENPLDILNSKPTCIMFRARTVITKQEVFGSLLSIRNKKYILPCSANYSKFPSLDIQNVMREVIPETICQYTQMDDKTSMTNIFQGDIVTGVYRGCEYRGTVLPVSGSNFLRVTHREEKHEKFSVRTPLGGLIPLKDIHDLQIKGDIFEEQT